MGLVSALHVLNPRRRRWQRLRDGLMLDPAALPPSPREPGERDFIICGHSRSGTTLLAAALHQPPNCITVVEPWDGMRMLPAELCASLRREALTGMMARGRLDVRALQRSGEVRWTRDGEHPYRVELGPDSMIGVKWPVYWQYLSSLRRTKFVVCVRDPVEIIASFEQTGGRLADGLDYDIRFNHRMNEYLLAATDDPATRRALLYEYVAQRIVAHLRDPNVFIARYERWFDDRDGLMSDIGQFLGIEVGRGLPHVRPPRSAEGRHDLVALVRRHCPSAAALGYGVGATAN